MPNDSGGELTNFDKWIAERLSSWGQRSSRRGLLARLGRRAMQLCGIALLPVLPLDRSFGQSSRCDWWQLCGIDGNLCSTTCCNESGGTWSCPDCTTRGSFWTKCCQEDISPPYYSEVQQYYDCCGTTGGYTDEQAALCKDDLCENDPSEGGIAWCSGLGAYRCTIVVGTQVRC